MNDLINPKNRETWLARLMADRLAPLLADDDSRAQFAALTLAALADRKLAACDPTSVALALVTCAELGLAPNSALDLAYLIPRGRVATVQIGYKGLAQLAHRANPGSTFAAHVVYRADRFVVELGTDSPRIEHVPDLDGDRSDDAVVAAYATMQTADGRTVFEYLTRNEIDQRRARGGGNSPAWKNHYASMARKSAIRKLLLGGLVPLTVDGARVVEALKREDERPPPADIVAEIIDANDDANPFAVDATDET